MSAPSLVPWSSTCHSLHLTESVASNVLHRPKHHALRHSKRSVQQHSTCIKRGDAQTATASTQQAFQVAFVQGLISASLCKEHRQKRNCEWQRSFTTSSLQSRTLLNDPILTSTVRRDASQSLNAAVSGQRPTYKVSHEELIGLVDYYKEDEEEQARDLDATSRAAEDSNGLALQKDLEEENRHVQATSDKLRRLLDDHDTPHELLMTTYRSLPRPGAARLSESLLRKLLIHLNSIPHKSHAAMLRYLSVVADMRAAGKPISVHVWTSAISFAGRSLKQISNHEVESALNVWKQMESQAGIRCNEVTFNVLFDVAAKAGKFVLADMILKEMESRGHVMNRYFRTGLIYYHGLKGDSSGVRRSYRELVQAGEIVDTTVVTCVIEALLKCGEPGAAEQVFERAKRVHANKTGGALPPTSWREERQLGRLLSAAAVRYRHDTATRRAVQDAAPMAPSLRTYRALIYYYAVTAGDIHRVSALVQEMEYFKLPVYGTIFLHLFKGFAMHGGLLYGDWSRARLETTYRAYVQALSTSAPATGLGDRGEVYLGKAAAELCLSAFVKCADAERAREVWEQLKEIWQPAEHDAQQVEAMLSSRLSRLEVARRADNAGQLQSAEAQEGADLQ